MTLPQRIVGVAAPRDIVDHHLHQVCFAVGDLRSSVGFLGGLALTSGLSRGVSVKEF
jgi:hypothetical protein